MGLSINQYFTPLLQQNKIQNLNRRIHPLLLWLVLQQEKSVYVNAIFLVVFFIQVGESNAQQKMSAVINAEK